MADTTTFTLDDPIFNLVQPQISQNEIDLINASPLLVALLREFGIFRGQYMKLFHPKLC